MECKIRSATGASCQLFFHYLSHLWVRTLLYIDNSTRHNVSRTHEFFRALSQFRWEIFSLPNSNFHLIVHHCVWNFKPAGKKSQFSSDLNRTGVCFLFHVGIYLCCSYKITTISLSRRLPGQRRRWQCTHLANYKLFLFLLRCSRLIHIFAQCVYI